MPAVRGLRDVSSASCDSCALSGSAPRSCRPQEMSLPEQSDSESVFVQPGRISLSSPHRGLLTCWMLKRKAGPEHTSGVRFQHRDTRYCVIAPSRAWEGSNDARATRAGQNREHNGGRKDKVCKDSKDGHPGSRFHKDMENVKDWKHDGRTGGDIYESRKTVLRVSGIANQTRTGRDQRHTPRMAGGPMLLRGPYFCHLEWWSCLIWQGLIKNENGMRMLLAGRKLRGHTCLQSG